MIEEAEPPLDYVNPKHTAEYWLGWNDAMTRMSEARSKAMREAAWCVVAAIVLAGLAAWVVL